MKILIETSTLVSASISWEYILRGRTKTLEQKSFKKCNLLFCICNDRKMQDDVIITKTVEDETRNVLNRAVNRTIRQRAPKGLKQMYTFMVLQHLILNDSLDKLDYYVEECSIRLPIDISTRNEIRDNEIEPYLKEIVKNTLRFLHPQISRVVRGRSFRIELIKKMIASLPEKGIVYKGMPEERDITIMAEATLLKRNYEDEEPFYVASLDKHFKPNSIQVFSYRSRDMMFTGELDPTIRDKLHEKFGFIGEDPQEINRILQEST